MRLITLVIAVGAALPAAAGEDAGSAAVDAGAPPGPLVTLRGEATALLGGSPSGVGGGLVLRGEATRTLGPAAWVRGQLALVAQLAPSTSPAAQSDALWLADNGSKLAFGVAPSGAADDGSLSLELYPLQGNRVRPSFDWADAWGQPLPFERGPAPLARLAWDHADFSVWAALRLGFVPEDQNRGTPGYTAVGLFGGLRFALPAGAAVEVRGGRFSRGRLAQQNGGTVPNVAWGGAARLSWQRGGGVGPQWDPTTYGSDPERFERFFLPEPSTGNAAWIGLEVGYASQNVFVPGLTLDPSAPATREQPAGHGDLQARLRLGPARLFGTLRLRSATLVRFDTSAFQSVDFADGAKVEPEVGGMLGADVRLGSTGLVPGLLLRLRRPATVETPGATPADPGSYLLLYGPLASRVLRPGDRAGPVFSAQVSLRYEFGSALVVAGSVDVASDPNALTYPGSPPTAVTRERVTTLSGLLVLQGRY